MTTDQQDLAGRLAGARLPDIPLRATDGKMQSLARLSGISVLYAYPRTSPPDGSAIPGWDEIPGAKGCTAQSCGFRNHFADLQALGVSQVFGLSVQSSAYQREAKERLHLPFDILSDEAFALQKALDLPILEAGGLRLLERFAMVVEDGIIRKVFHPVLSPAENAEDIACYLKGRVKLSA